MSGAGETPTLLDEETLAKLHEDFASTDDLDELAELMRRFGERGAEQLDELRAAAAAEDGEATRRAAHKLKGASRTLGASACGAVAARIEDAAAAGDVAAAARAVPELEAALASTRAALSNWLAAQRSP